MKSFADYTTEDRRLTLLRGLVAATQWKANAFLLQRFCESLGHTASADRIEQDLAWLEEQGLVKLDKSSGTTVAQLTRRGDDVACGRVEVPGVQRPVPGT